MKVTHGPLKGLIIIEPKIFEDTRGYFFEAYQEKRFAELGIPAFVQDNVSYSKKNVLRGMHYQFPQTQGKLVSVSRGEVWDVVVDVRRDSKTFGEWFGITLSESNHTQMYVPPGFAHGFCVLSDEAYFHYKCTTFYAPHCEKGLRWNDKRVNIAWPIEHPIILPKDENYPSLDDIAYDQLPA